MQSILLISPDQRKSNSYISGLKKKHGIPDFNVYEINEEKVGIDDVRRMTAEMKVKPLGGGLRLTVIRNFSNATLPAQNAMLKNLEEPSASNIIMLVSKNLNGIIQTVVSRCFTVRLDTLEKEGKTEKLRMFLSKINISSPGERLLLAMEHNKDRQSVINFLESVIAISGDELSGKGKGLLDPASNASIIKKAQTAKKAVEGNVNAKAVLDVFLLSFPKKN